MGTRDELAALVTLLDATGARPLIDRDAADGPRPRDGFAAMADGRRVRQDRVHPLMATHLLTGAGSGIGAVLAERAARRAATPWSCWPARPNAPHDLRPSAARTRRSLVADLADADASTVAGAARLARLGACTPPASSSSVPSPS